MSHRTLRGTQRHIPQSHFAKFSPNLSYYFLETTKAPNVLPFNRNMFRQPDVDEKFQKRVFVDKTIDYTEKEQMDESEAMRHPKERDFYQDHAYHEEWIERNTTKDQRKQLTQRYSWMIPGYEIKPWIWHQGDLVEIVKGPFAGQRGTILNVVKYKNECFVQNVNVQPIVIPASESRPEQTIQREHPISVALVKHVDPQTNQPCDVKLVTVRDKETGEKIERRMSLSSGALLQIAKVQETIETGDPMYDTPLEDAEEPTYLEEKEAPVMVARKLRVMEDYFVNQLKEAHEHHNAYRRSNAEFLRRYQEEVVCSAANKVLQQFIRSKKPLANQEAWLEACEGVELPASLDDEEGAAQDDAFDSDEATANQ